MKERNLEDAKEILEIIDYEFNHNFYKFYNKRLYRSNNKNGFTNTTLYHIIYNCKNFYIVYVSFYKYTKNTDETFFLFDDLKEATKKWEVVKEIDFLEIALKDKVEEKLDDETIEFLKIFN